MKLNKTLLKTLSSIILVLPIVYAGECEELKEYFEDKDVYFGDCEENADGKVNKINLYDSNMGTGMTEEDMNKILSYDTITSINYSTGVDGYYYSSQEKEDIPNNIDKLINLKKLKNLESLTISYDATVAGGIGYYQFLAYGNIAENTLKDLTSLKYLRFYGIELSQKNIEDISTLTNLETLFIIESVVPESNDYKSLSKLENLKYLEIQPRGSDGISEFVNTIKSVKELVLVDINKKGGVKIDSLPNVEKISWFMNQFDVSSLGKLNKLETLEFNFGYYDDISSLEKVNQIKKLIIKKDRISPGAAGNGQEEIILKFSEESQLKDLTLQRAILSDSNVKEILKLKNLEKLDLKFNIFKELLSEEGVKLLKSLESRCSLEVNYHDDDFEMYGIEIKSFKNEPCNGSVTSDINSSTIKTTTVEKSTSNITKTVTKTTTIAEPTTTIKTSINYKCGKNIGKCRDGECCSKYGWCGKSKKHCLVSKGCQSEFGKCTNDVKISTNYRCGETDGKCRDGECCSKYGWCGKSDDHCLVSKGCQSEFGKCTVDVKISTNYRCGKTDGRCRDGECCSKYGWCGKSDKHCLVSKGCQSEFGKCK